MAGDRPASVECLNLDADEEVDTFLEASLHNLRQISVSCAPFGDTGFHVVEGSFYASSKILDPAFLQGLARVLGSDTLFVAVPTQSAALVGSEDPALFVRVVEAIYEDIPPGERISPMTFVAAPEQGVVGIVRAQPREREDGEDDGAASAPPGDASSARASARPSRPWWKRLLGL
jgi:hypothetical protein